MKRKASHFLGSSSPAKLRKESTNKTVHQNLTLLKNEKSVVKAPLQPAKWPSFGHRERKAPSWLSSYVTNSAQEKEVKKEKSKLPRFPTLVPPSKQKEAVVKKSKDDKSDEGTTSLLRRQSTLKLQSPPISPEATPFNKRSKQKAATTASLTKKSTEILSSSDTDASERLDSNNSTKRKKISVLGKEPERVNVLSHKSETKLKVKKATSIPKKHQLKEVNGKQNCTTNVVEICDNKHFSNQSNNKFERDGSLLMSASKPKPMPSIKPKAQGTFNMQKADTIAIQEQIRPNMLEVVICISTSGALRDYLAVLQDRIREMIWRLQSLVPNLRIGVMAHTQGGIHDDHTRSSCGSGDHNYNRVGGHSGTKWLDLGATLSQICAFVDSLEPEPTVYPDYVQDNLEMALWKLQRCMSWSSCSYRSVIMIGRGRPNRTSFYLQKEHWRSWIRSALELKSNSEIPVIDWELEAKLLAEMGIHVFTLQGTKDSAKPVDEDEGTVFFRRVAEITQGQNVRISDPSRLVEIILGICCACHGPELLSDHRDTVRDDNDGVLPSQLTEVFVSLQLHSKCSSLAALPSLLGNLDIAGMRQRLTNSQSSIMECCDEEEAEETRHSLPMEVSMANQSRPSITENGRGLKKTKGQRLEKKPADEKPLGVKAGRVKKNSVVRKNKANKTVKQAVKAITKGSVVTKVKVFNGVSKRVTERKVKDGPIKMKDGFVKGGKLKAKNPSKGQVKRSENFVKKSPYTVKPLKRKAENSSERTKNTKPLTPSSIKKPKKEKGKSPEKASKSSAVLKAKAALKLKAAKTKVAGKRGRPRSVAKENGQGKSQLKSSATKKRTAGKKTPVKNGGPKAKKTSVKDTKRKNSSVSAAAKNNVKVLTKRKTSH